MAFTVHRYPPSFLVKLWTLERERVLKKIPLLTCKSWCIYIYNAAKRNCQLSVGSQSPPKGSMNWKALGLPSGSPCYRKGILLLTCLELPCSSGIYLEDREEIELTLTEWRLWKFGNFRGFVGSAQRIGGNWRQIRRKHFGRNSFLQGSQEAVSGNNRVGNFGISSAAEKMGVRRNWFSMGALNAISVLPRCPMARPADICRQFWPILLTFVPHFWGILLHDSFNAH